MNALAPSFLLLVIHLDPQAPALRPVEDVRTAFHKIVDRPRVALEPTTASTETDRAGRIVERMSFTSERKPDGEAERVPALLVRPKGGPERRPAVIALHGTGGTKEGMRDWLDAIADRGMIAVAIDGRHHGERAGGAKGAEAYNRAIIRAWRSKPGEPQEHPFYYDTCWDVWRTVDYLRSRPDVDPDRIGLIGISKGGIETYLAGAVDERIEVAVPAISVQSFRWGQDHDRWQARARTIAAATEAVARDRGADKVDLASCQALFDKVVPGIAGDFDGPSILRLFGGRPLLILNGEADPNCPIEGARLAFAAAEAAHREAGAADRIKIMVAPNGPHTVPKDQRDAALDWLSRWLTP